MIRSVSTAAIVAAVIHIAIIPTNVAASMGLADFGLPTNQNGPNVTTKLTTASIAIRKGLVMIDPTSDVRHCSADSVVVEIERLLRTAPENLE